MPLTQSSYLDRFGLTNAPFKLAPDPRFFFPAKPHLAAREVLRFGIQNDEGFMVLSGPAGTGKTLLLRVLLAEIGKNKITVLLTNPVVTPAGLLHQILQEIGIKMDAKVGQENLLATFQKVILRLASMKKSLLIVIDEAQNIPMQTLEYLRMLSNIETNQQKLLQILLTGQPELTHLLQDKRLAQLSQRITVSETLRPLSVQETVKYVNYRLTKAGRGDLVLTASARRTLHRSTGGIPRLINRLMDRTLLVACSDYKGKITKKHVMRAAKTLPEYSPKKPVIKLLSYGLTLACLVLVCFAIYYYLGKS